MRKLCALLAGARNFLWYTASVSSSYFDALTSLKRSIHWPALALLGAALTACAGEVGEVASDEPTIEVGSDELATVERLPDGSYTVYGASVRECSTTHVQGLVDQLIAEMNCANPDAMVRIDNIPGVQLQPAASPYLQGAAARALAVAAAAAPGVRVNSSLRALPQQYMLYRWSLRDRCGVRLAAEPGESKHESGLSLDIGNWQSRRGVLGRAGFQWYGWGDAVHFTFRGKAAKPVAGESTRAFKRLWNRNHPEDQLVDNEFYTRETELRLKRSPSRGFARGAQCHPGMQEDSGPSVQPSDSM